MENFPTKIKHIIKGLFNYTIGKNKELSFNRLKYCNRCEYLEVIDNQKICGLCGCFINLKTSVKEEKCPSNKW